jgi:hypothetical protein
VDGTYSVKQLGGLMSASLFELGGMYTRRANGDLQFDGVRPAGSGQHAHGYCFRKLATIVGGRIVQRRLWKRRWRDREMGDTCHSRPPNDAAQVWSCTLIVALLIWAQLDGDQEARADAACESDLFAELQAHVSARTVKRWVRRAVADAPQVEQALRYAVIERCEPRPVEHLFPSGLSPPASLLLRRWRGDSSEIVTLWRAFALLFGAAITLGIPAACLLAEARGRKTASKSTFPF